MSDFRAVRTTTTVDTLYEAQEVLKAADALKVMNVRLVATVESDEVGWEVTLELWGELVAKDK